MCRLRYCNTIEILIPWRNFTGSRLRTLVKISAINNTVLWTKDVTFTWVLRQWYTWHSNNNQWLSSLTKPSPTNPDQLVYHRSITVQPQPTAVIITVQFVSRWLLQILFQPSYRFNFKIPCHTGPTGQLRFARTTQFEPGPQFDFELSKLFDHKI